VVLKSVLIKVDLPKPDSPRKDQRVRRARSERPFLMGRTNDHYGELKALPHALAVDLVWKVRETDVSHELLADDGGN
jgi:hypothetical protein